MAARQLIFARPGLKAGGGERIAQTAGRLSDLAAPQAAGGSPGVLAGDGAVALEVEALEVRLEDVTRPYRAPSGRVPDHG